jgi:hypothetical protein
MSLKPPAQGGPPEPSPARRGLDASVAERFPRLSAYLAKLPAGIASYPECKVRTGTYEHVLLSDAGSRPSLAGVDSHVRDFLLVPSRGLWVPEVNLLAGILAVGDQYGLSPEQHFDWLLERNRQLFRSVVYRAVMAFFSPEMLLRKSSERWGSFHLGTEFRTQYTSGKEAMAELIFPPHLFDEVVLKVFAGVFVAALERANAQWVSMTVTQVTPTRGPYKMEWR